MTVTRTGNRRFLGTIVAVATLATVVLGIGGDRAEAALTITEYASGTSPSGITTGPDGNLWYTEMSGAIVRLTPAGARTAFTAGLSPDAMPLSITTGADGNLWFSEGMGGRVGRITPAGVITEFSTGISPSAMVRHMATGADGNVWFTEIRNMGAVHAPGIGRVTPAGVITEFTTGFGAFGDVGDITAGPDGNLWFTRDYPSAVGRITPAGAITEYPLASAAGPAGITAGPDGNLWVSNNGSLHNVARVTPAGVVSYFPIAGGYPLYITAGGDGALWLTFESVNTIGRITTTGEATVETIGSSAGQDLTWGPDGALWVTEALANKVMRLAAAAPGGGDGSGATTTTSTTTTTTPGTTGVVPPGGTVESDAFGNPVGPGKPPAASISTPVGGTISITPATASAVPAGYTVVGSRYVIEAPAATVATPLSLSFTLPLTSLGTGNVGRATILRDGVPVLDCATAEGATPDPCLAERRTSGTTVTLVVRSSHASSWDVATTPVGRLAGLDRLATAVASSRAAYPGGGAPAAVLARGDGYADALSGGPLAVAKKGPLLLLSSATSLPSTVEAELVRVLAPGATVYLLGGDRALAPAIESRLRQLQLVVRRVAGPDRSATSVAVAQEIGTPARLFLATGQDFTDALIAGPAAAAGAGAVLLTDGRRLSPSVASYLAAHPAVPRTAVGGAAAAAAPSAEAVIGTDRYDTAARVATRFFPNATQVGVTNGERFGDALACISVLGPAASPLLLTSVGSLAPATDTWLRAHRSTVRAGTVFGGVGVVTEPARAAVVAALAGSEPYATSTPPVVPLPGPRLAGRA